MLFCGSFHFCWSRLVGIPFLEDPSLSSMLSSVVAAPLECERNFIMKKAKLALSGQKEKEKQLIAFVLLVLRNRKIAPI